MVNLLKVKIINYIAPKNKNSKGIFPQYSQFIDIPWSKSGIKS